MTDIQWYIQVGAGKKAGPISFERLRKIARQGKIFPSTKVRSDEAEAIWVPADEVPGLFDEETSGKPTEVSAETADADLPTEEATNFEAITVEPVEVTESKKDEEEEKKPEPSSFQTGAIVVDVGKSSSKKEKAAKSEKKKAWSGFVIDTSDKKDQHQSEPAVQRETTKKDEQVEEPKKPDKSSVAVKIDLGGMKKKNTEESSTVVVSGLDLSTKTKKSDQSSSAVKISFGASKKKNEDASKIFESKKPKQKEKKERTPAKTREKKPKVTRSGGGLPLLLKASSITAFLIGGLGAVGLVTLGLQKAGIPFAIASGSVVLLLGAILGVVSWCSAELATRLALLEKPESEQRQKAEEDDSAEET